MNTASLSPNVSASPALSAWPKRGAVERVSNLSRAEFEARFITSFNGEGRPVILTDAMDHWACARKWSLDYFRREFGHLLVVRCWCRNSRKKPYFAVGYELELAAYIDYCRHGDLRRPPLQAKMVGDAPLEPDSPSLYWYENLARPEFRPLLDDFDVELGFVDNLQSRLTGEWRKLVFYFPFANLFIGGAGANVALHQDYWSTHTLIAHLEGRKHAMLFAPHEGGHLFNQEKEPIDPRKPDPAQFPTFAEATLYECILEPGETLFMPPNWLHDVVSLDATLSLGMNFFTTHNFGEYFSNLLCYPLQIHQILSNHPVLSKAVRDASGKSAS